MHKAEKQNCEYLVGGRIHFASHRISSLTSLNCASGKHFFLPQLDQESYDDCLRYCYWHYRSPLLLTKTISAG